MKLGSRACGLLGASVAHAHRFARAQSVKKLSTFADRIDWSHARRQVQRVPGFPRQSWRADGLIAKVPPIIPAPSTTSDILSGPTSSHEAKKSEAKPMRSSVDDIYTWTTPKAYQIISDPNDFVETEKHEGVREAKILAAYDPPPSLAVQQMSTFAQRVPSFPRPSSRADGHLAKVPPIIPAPVIPVPSVCDVYRRSM
jgi:hypothetical protein